MRTSSQLTLLALLALATATSPVCGQSSSLYGKAARKKALALENSSWTHVKVQAPGEEIQLNDLITVIVKESTEFISEGEVNRRMKSSLDARLQDWLKLDGLNIGPAPQPNGDPRARGSLDSQLVSQTELENRDAMQFRITARVVDIRPNGLMVLEAHKRVKNNDEDMEQSLTGIVRREDILPNNTVLSEKIAELDIYKRERGHVRDGSRRGWLLKTMDFLKPI